jgi:serine/threonine protein kinase
MQPSSQGFNPSQAPSPKTSLCGLSRPDSTSADQDNETSSFSFLAEPQEPDELGRLAHYRVLKVIGRGGMGVVFHAEDLHLQRPVGLKVMRPDAAGNLAGRTRFLREARATAALRCDHVVTIYQVGMENDVPFLAMELLQGESLDGRLERGCWPALPEALRLGREMALGLAAAHQKGLVHRDIKPSNIWLETPGDRVKLLDFGLARNEGDSTELTQSGMVVGTPAYMAPEQARGESLDPRCDLFSLGVVLYRLCSRTMPFACETTMALLTALAVADPRPVNELNPEIPPELAELIHQLLEKAPAARPASAGVVAGRLQAIHPKRGASPDGAPHLGASTGGERAVANRDSMTSQLKLRPPRRVPFARKVVLAAMLLTGSALLAGLARPFLLDGSESSSANSTDPSPDSGRRKSPAKKKTLSPDEKWRRWVAALPTPGQQVQAVVDRLKQLNPGFDGEVRPTIEKGVVAGLEFQTDHVTNISPLRALTGLKVLSCSGSALDKGKLADLSPLRGLPLKELTCSRNNISDLTPLQGMKLTKLDLLLCTQVWDLTPLQGMPLTYLNVYVCRGVTDLTPLRGMKLTFLDVGSTGIADLSPLREMPLSFLNLFGCNGVKVLTALEGMPLTNLNISCCRQVADLTPLRRLPLTELYIEDCEKAQDLTPLRDLELETLIFTPHLVKRGLAGIRAMKSLKAIDSSSPPRLTADEFWKNHDARERQK